MNKEAEKNERVIDCLLQIHIAQEETKFGLSEEDLQLLLGSDAFREMKNIRIRGVMGMATYTENSDQIREEFRHLKRIFDSVKNSQHSGQDSFDQLSCGMSGDYLLAVEEGSNHGSYRQPDFWCKELLKMKHMIDLSTTFAGLNLKSPIIVSSSGLTTSVDRIKKMAAGRCRSSGDEITVRRTDHATR